MMFVGAGVCALLAVLFYLWGAWQAIAQHNDRSWNDAALLMWIYAAGFVLVGIVFRVTGSGTRAGSGGNQWLTTALYAALACGLLFLVQFCRFQLGMISDSAHWPDASLLAGIIAVACAVAGAFARQR